MEMFATGQYSTMYKYSHFERAIASIVSACIHITSILIDNYQRTSTVVHLLSLQMVAKDVNMT